MKNRSLETFRDLDVKGPRGRLEQLGDTIESELASSKVWARDREWEQRTREALMGSDTLTSFVFTRASDELPAASVCLIVRDDGASVANIVPAEIHELSIAQYNAVLEAFVNDGLESAVGKLGLELSMTDASRPITDWLTEAAARKLELFSAAANKSTGSAHPSDRERWYAFIIQAHRDQCELNSELLRRWLMEIERWPEEEAYELIQQYDFGSALLQQFDEDRPSPSSGTPPRPRPSGKPDLYIVGGGRGKRASAA